MAFGWLLVVLFFLAVWHAAKRKERKLRERLERERFFRYLEEDFERDAKVVEFRGRRAK
jgi:hypothetical protein